MVKPIQHHLDLQYLEQVTQGDPELLRELLHLFFDESQKRLHQLQTAIEKKDQESAHREVHTLKGSSSHLGESDFHATTSTMEKQLTPQQVIPLNWQTIHEQFHQLQIDFYALKQKVISLL